jgi:hypothetical protein
MLLVAALWAREFRALAPIPRPDKLPEGAVAIQTTSAVNVKTVETAVKNLASAWNSQALDSMLDDRFYDKQRLIDSLVEKAPRDAQLQILGIQNVQVLQQFVQPAEADRSGAVRVSRVSATVRTQIEFNDPAKGFQRIQGVNEFILEVREEIRQ